MSSTHNSSNAGRGTGTPRDLISHADIGFAFGLAGAPVRPAAPGRRPPGSRRWVKVVRFALPTVGLVAALGGMVALTLGAGSSKKNQSPEPSTTAPLAEVTASSPSATALDVRPTAGVPASPTITLPTDPVVAPAAPSAAPPSAATPPTAPPPAHLAQDPVLTQTPNLASAGAGPSSAPAAPVAAPRAKAGAAPVASATATATGTATAASYTVRKGDTLFKIAKDHYGDGKQWSRIVAVNPGLTPASLKAGQKLHLP